MEFKDEKEFSMTSNIRDNDQVLLLSPKNKKKRKSFFFHSPFFSDIHVHINEKSSIEVVHSENVVGHVGHSEPR